MGARMDDHAVADQRGQHRRGWADRSVPADPHLGADHRIRADDRARADLHARPDDRARIDHDAPFESRGRMNDGGRRNSRLIEDRTRLDRGRIKLRHHRRHGAVGLWRHEDRAARGRGARVAGRDQRRRGAGGSEGVEVAGIVEKGQIARIRFLKSRDIGDDTAGVRFGNQRGATPACDFPKRWRRTRRKETNLGQVGVPPNATAGAPLGAPALDLPLSGGD